MDMIHRHAPDAVLSKKGAKGLGIPEC